MYSSIRDKAIAFHQSFHKSAVIWFARAQVLVGVVWSVLILTDLSPFITDRKYFTMWLVMSGVITELSRRHGTCIDDQNHMVPPRCIDVNPPGV